MAHTTHNSSSDCINNRVLNIAYLWKRVYKRKTTHVYDSCVSKWEKLPQLLAVASSAPLFLFFSAHLFVFLSSSDPLLGAYGHGGSCPRLHPYVHRKSYDLRIYTQQNINTSTHITNSMHTTSRSTKQALLKFIKPLSLIYPPISGRRFL